MAGEDDGALLVGLLEPCDERAPLVVASRLRAPALVVLARGLFAPLVLDEAGQLVVGLARACLLVLRSALVVVAPLVLLVLLARLLDLLRSSLFLPA